LDHVLGVGHPSKDAISHTDQQVTVLVEDAGSVRPIRGRDEVRHGTSSSLLGHKPHPSSML